MDAKNEKTSQKVKKVLDKLESRCYNSRVVTAAESLLDETAVGFEIGYGSSGVPCKLNNEKHEQTPWTILIEKTKVVLKMSV